MIDHDTGPSRQTKEMIDREWDRRKISKALDPGDKSFQLVLVRAEGGLGKTRLLEEALRWAGHPDFCQSEERSPWTGWASDLIDVIDIRLHDSYRFVDRIRQGFRAYDDPPVIFPTYDSKNRVGRETAAGAFLESMNKAKQEAIAAFEADLKKIAKEKRVAIIVDTIERLEPLTLENLFGPEPDEGLSAKLAELLDPEKDLSERTYQWLSGWIKKCQANKDDANITLVLAGRPESPLFDTLGAAPSTVVDLKPLSDKGVRDYFQQLANDERRRKKKNKKGATEIPPQAEEPDPIASDPDKYKVLHLYTGGSPIRLALYRELVKKGKQIPPQLQLSYDQACKEVGIDPKAVIDEKALKNNSKLEVIRWKVEEAFIDLLFQGVGREARVMLALIRSPRGLTAAQLHFLLDSKDGEKAANWQPNEKKLRKLEKILKRIERSSLGKRRSAWQDLAEIWPHDYDTHRVGLQDEIYTIFCDHTGLWSDFPDVPNNKIDNIRAHLRREKGDYEQLFRDEKEAREKQYTKLADWAKHWCDYFRAEKRDYLAKDEARLEERLRLDNPYTFRFPFVDEETTRKRAAINAAITIFEIENLVYNLLLNTEVQVGLNNMALEDNRDLASRREDDFWAQSEVRQLLDDENLMRFASLGPEHVAIQRRTEKREDSRYAVIQRVARQQEAARWIKRFVFTGQYGRAIDFSNKLDKLAWELRQDNTKGKNLFQSWNHSLARGERIIWRNYARILRGEPGGDKHESNDSNESPIKEIEEFITVLTKLYEKPYTRMVNRPTDDYPYQENGFASKDPNDSAGAHPGWPRLGWILSHAHNILGYGYRQRGQYAKAVEHHARALDIIRPSPYKEMAKDHLARVLNNQARALMELGQQSEVVALDGLNLRRELAEEVTLAASLNTLARIYDRAGRHEDAAHLSAKAIALCERAGESRQLGLSLLQMASALRHRAYTVRQGRQSVVDPEIYITAAEELLFRAAELFRDRDESEPDSDNYNKDHRVGLVQVQLERGRLLRDRLRHERPAAESGSSRAHNKRLGNRAKTIYQEACETLNWVKERIKDGPLDLPHISLNVETNLARVDYYYYLLLSQIKRKEARELQRLQTSVENTLGDIRQDDKYREHRNYLRYSPDSNQKVYSQLFDQTWIFRQLSTAEKLSGRLQLNQYLRLPSGDKGSPQAAEHLRRAFTHYATAAQYAELFAPRGRSVIALQDDLYAHLNRSNQHELRFQFDQLQAVIAQNKKNVRLVTLLERITTLYHNFFGLPKPKRTRRKTASPDTRDR